MFRNSVLLEVFQSSLNHSGAFWTPATRIKDGVGYGFPLKPT